MRLSRGWAVWFWQSPEQFPCHLNVEGSSAAPRGVPAFTGSSVPHGTAAQLHTQLHPATRPCAALHVL